MSRSKQLNSNCIGNMIFQSKKTGEKLCLNKKRKDLEKLTCDGYLCGKENKPKDNVRNDPEGIVGGKFAGENQFPWYAMIILNYTNSETLQTNLVQWCGGSLITEKVILSAGHCVDGGF